MPDTQKRRKNRVGDVGFGLIALLWLCLGTCPTAAIAQQYLIGPGDLLRITVFKNPDLTSDVRVSDAGLIGFPLIGAVKVGGTTLSQTEVHIADLLKEGGFVLNPQVNVLLTQAVAYQVAVLGQVNRPGRYPIDTAGGHVSGMLAAAGGISTTGSDVVIVTGTRDGKPFHREIDMIKLSQGGNSADDIALAGGDTLFVNRAPFFYINGEVQHPGQYRLERDMTVLQAISAGGGVTAKGTKRGVVLHRRDAHGKVNDVHIDLNASVQNEDVIEVKESLF